MFQCMLHQRILCGRSSNGDDMVLHCEIRCAFAALSVQPVAAWPAKLYPDAAIYRHSKGSFFLKYESLQARISSIVILDYGALIS